MKWRVIVTRDVELTQSCTVTVEADDANEAEDKALLAAGTNGDGCSDWADDDGSYDYATNGVYIGGPECVQGIDDKANGD